jgi:hypothetical protein
MSLERVGQGWRSSQPIDAARVDGIVMLLDRAVALRTVDPARVGRARATYSLGFSRRTSSLTVGDETDVPPGGAYVRLDDRAMVVSREVAQALLQSPLELLETVVWGVAASDLTALTIGVEPSERRLVHRNFTLLSHDGARVSRKKVDKLFSLLLTLRVQHWLPPRTTLDAPLRVAMDTADGPRVMWLGGPCPDGMAGHIARFDGERYACVAGALAPAVRAVAEAPADDALFSMRRDEVERVTLRAPGRVFDAARREGRFRLIEPEGRALSTDEAEALERWLDKLLGVAGVPSLAASTAASPSRVSELTVKAVDGLEERVFLDARSAHRVVDGRTLAVAPGALDVALDNRLPSEPRWLLPRALASALSRVWLKCSAIRYEWAAAGDRWSLVSPPALRGFVSRWEATLEVLRAAKRGDEMAAPTGRPVCTLRLNSEAAISFTIGNGGRSVALVGGKAFEVPRSLVDALDRDFIDPGCLLGDRDRELQTVRLGQLAGTKGGRPLSPAQIAMGDLLAIVEGARVARLGPVEPARGWLAQWGDQVVVGSRTDHGRLFARCGNQPVTFSIDAAAFKGAIGLSEDAD